MADSSSKVSLPSTPLPQTPSTKTTSKAKVTVPNISSAKPISVNPATSSSKPKYNDYRCYNVPEMKQLYVKMLNDNLLSLINYIYSQQTVEPYNSPATRVALSMQMLLASNQLIPYQQASAIIKDIEALRADAGYLDQWVNASLKRKALMKEIEMVRKHTEIDDTISLNLANQPDTMGGPDGEDLKNFDMNSGISTLNVSAQMPVDNLDGDQGRCTIM
jgi:hypothetical protein